MSKVPMWVWISVVAAVLTATWSVGMRHRAEAENRAVGLMMDMDDVATIAASSNVKLQEALVNLRGHGLVGVSISEETVGDLLADGRLRTVTGREIYGMEANRAAAFLGAATPITRTDGFVRFENATVKEFLKFPVGINPVRAQAARNAEVEITARHGNWPGLKKESIEMALHSSMVLGANSYLIAGDQAIGNRKLLKTTRDEIRKNGLFYYSPEFVQLGGDAFLRKNLQDQGMRLHSITQLEIEKLSENEIIDRVVKAFRERDVRWILLRPASQAAEDPLLSAGELLFILRGAIREQGGDVKLPRPFREPGVPSWYAGLVALLALPAVLWTTLEVFGRHRWGIIVALLAVLGSLSGFYPPLRGLSALTVAIVFPVLGYLLAFRDEKSSPLNRFLTVSAASLAGGFCVAGMLVGVEYFLRVNAFLGVKAALLLPLLVVGALLLNQYGGIKTVMLRPVNWLSASVVLFGLAVIVLLAARTGNDNPASVSSIEIAMRSYLDKLLYVRPRTKEVFFGHPAMVVGVLLWNSRRDLRGWAGLLVLAGMVGQTGMVNTMCHLHTPVALSLMRNLVGLIAGGIIGMLLWVIVKRWIAPMEPSQENG